MKTIHILLLVFVLWIILQNRNDGYQIEKYSIPPTSAYWQRAVYSPELDIWVTVGIPEYHCLAVSSYSKDGIKWNYNLPSSGGLPVQYGPLSQYGWHSVTYGNSQFGPLFVAVSDGYDNWDNSVNIYNRYYVNGQITTVDNYVSVATSTDGINWTTGTGLFPYGYWIVTYDPVSQYFQAVGDLTDRMQSVYNSYGAQSIDGVNWQMTNSPFGVFEVNDICYGTQGVLAGGVQDGPTQTAVTNILPSYTTIWNLSSNIPQTEDISSVKFLQGAYYATGLYGLYESTDGINWTNLNVTDVNANTLFTGRSILSDIDYFNGNFILHICQNLFGSQFGQFYYSQYATGPYSLGIYGNIMNDTFRLRLSANQNVIVGLGEVNVWSGDGINWNT